MLALCMLMCSWAALDGLAKQWWEPNQADASNAAMIGCSSRMGAEIKAARRKWRESGRAASSGNQTTWSMLQDFPRDSFYHFAIRSGGLLQLRPQELEADRQSDSAILRKLILSALLLATQSGRTIRDVDFVFSVDETGLDCGSMATPTIRRGNTQLVCNCFTATADSSTLGWPNPYFIQDLYQGRLSMVGLPAGSLIFIGVHTGLQVWGAKR
jgi:hypothetical protein